MNKNCNFTIKEIEAFLKSRRVPYAATVDDVVEYWDKKDWLTNKGFQVSTVASLVNVANSYVVEQKRKAGVLDAKEKNDIKNKNNEWTYSKSRYYDQLATPQWSAYREFIFSVRGRSCELCGHKKNLHIHHVKYINNRFAWEYLPSEVMVLCGNCHRHIHRIPER